jgi:hypothetical protein
VEAVVIGKQLIIQIFIDAGVLEKSKLTKEELLTIHAELCSFCSKVERIGYVSFTMYNGGETINLYDILEYREEDLDQLLGDYHLSEKIEEEKKGE